MEVVLIVAYIHTCRPSMCTYSIYVHSRHHGPLAICMYVKCVKYPCWIVRQWHGRVASSLPYRHVLNMQI